MIGPVDHIGGGVEPPVHHLKAGGVILIMARVEVDRTVVDEWSRIGGEVGLDNRISRSARGRNATPKDSQKHSIAKSISMYIQTLTSRPKGRSG